MTDQMVKLRERCEKGLTTEKDAELVEVLARDLEELLAGVHRLASEALEALEAGAWKTTRQDLERLAEIG